MFTLWLGQPKSLFYYVYSFFFHSLSCVKLHLILWAAPCVIGSLHVPSSHMGELWPCVHVLSFTTHVIPLQYVAWLNQLDDAMTWTFILQSTSPCSFLCWSFTLATKFISCTEWRIQLCILVPFCILRLLNHEKFRTGKSYGSRAETCFLFL